MSKLDRAIEKLNEAIAELNEVTNTVSVIANPGRPSHVNVWSLRDLEQVPGVAKFENIEDSNGFVAQASKVHKDTLFVYYLTAEEYRKAI